MKDVVIIVNTSGRGDTPIKVMETVKGSHYPVRIVCPHDQAKVYRASLQEYLRPGIELYPLPKSVAPFLATQRMYAFKEAHSDGFHKAIIMDDDISILKRKVIDGNVRLRGVTDINMFLWDILKVFQEPNVGLVGIPRRQMHFFFEGTLSWDKGVAQCWMLDLDVYHKEKFTLTPIPEPMLCHDSWISFSFLDAGYHTVLHYGYAVQDKGQNAKGGISRYRSYDNCMRVSKFFVQRFPNAVKMRMARIKLVQSNQFPVGPDGKTSYPTFTARWSRVFRRRHGGIKRFL